ncbi:hypothetical protein CKJ90_33290, partial [Klebsiella pneumoniae]
IISNGDRRTCCVSRTIRLPPTYYFAVSITHSAGVIISNGDRRTCCVSRTIRLPPTYYFAVSITHSA